jgi:alpha-glucosidase
MVTTAMRWRSRRHRCCWRLEGSICLWEGEELGQTDTELALEELTDPQGIAFWPEPVGRDNTRTPMVWDASPERGLHDGHALAAGETPAGCTARGGADRARGVGPGTLPGDAGVPESQSLRCGRGGPGSLTCLTPCWRSSGARGGRAPVPVQPVADPHELRVTGAGVPVGPSVVAVLKGDRVTLAPHAAVFLPVTGKLAVSE